MQHAPIRRLSGGMSASVPYGLLWLLLLAAAVPQSAGAATLYVRTSGSDASDGSAPALALRTITHAAALAKPGDRIVVGAGTYAEGVIAPAAFGRISFIADCRGTETGDAGDVILDANGFADAFEFNHNLAMKVDGFVIYGGVIGLYVKSQSDQAVISNNIISDNTGRGVYIQDSKNVIVFNNLVYNNGSDGVLVTGNVSGSPGAQVINNTIYGNAGRGIFFSGTTIGSPGGLVMNNITQANGVAGLEVNATSRSDYLSAGNVIADRLASGTALDITDSRNDPGFTNPAGPDQILGGLGYADDDFHLDQTSAGQAVTSAAVNVGADLARRFRLERASTRSDGRPDVGFVDAGYHYKNFGIPPLRPQLRIRSMPLYVSATNGSDANDGATPATAIRSLARALTLAQAGNRVLLLGGRYAPDPSVGQLRLANSGRSGREIVIQGMNGAVIDGSGFERAMVLSGRSNIRLADVEVTGASSTGIEISGGSSNITLRGCHLYGNGDRALYVKGATVAVQGSLIENNGSKGLQVETAQLDMQTSTVSHNGEHGLWVLAGGTASVSRSQFAGNGRTGVLSQQGSVVLSSSTVSGGNDGGVRILSGSTATLSDVAITDSPNIGVQGVSSSITMTGGSIEHSAHVGVAMLVDAAQGGTSQLTMNDVRVCNNQESGVVITDSDVTLTGVTACSNMEDGLRQKGGSAQIQNSFFIDNNGNGITIGNGDQVTVQGGTVARNAEDGVQFLTVAGATISGSEVFSNRGNGLTILDSPSPVVFNDLVYGNTSSGLVISGDTIGSPNAQVLNNTIYGNANRGLLLGGGNGKPPSPNPTVLRNIFAGNGVAGLQVNETSRPGYVGDYNFSADAYGPGNSPGLHDIIGDPLFVNSAAGDFHLGQRAAGQAASSSAVDAGGVSVTDAGVDGLTTRTDGVPDSGTVDMGYHYQP